jgi:hypothetical protein
VPGSVVCHKVIKDIEKRPETLPGGTAGRRMFGTGEEAQ